MTNEEVNISTAQAVRLIDRQFPEFAGQPVRPLAMTGTDNWMFRLGTTHVLRFPRRHAASGLLRREAEWLPRLSDLPLQIPEYVAHGEPGEGYPWSWAVLNWIPGERAELTTLHDPRQAAQDLANFVRALQANPGMSGPIAGSINHRRGVPLEQLDQITRESIEQLHDLFDTRDLLEIWETVLNAPSWDGPPLWVHGDLNTGNLLAREGRLAAVIDFGLCARGDPAADLTPGWLLFERAEREVFLSATQHDNATLMRGMGWALYAGVVALAYYRNTNLSLARMTHRAISEILGDVTV